MQITFWPRWLMIVSTATAVLPVWRSPMMSSALAAADGHHAVDGSEARLQRLLHGAAIDDARREPLDRHELLRRDRPLPSIA
jgi:hypothetical protein